MKWYRWLVLAIACLAALVHVSGGFSQETPTKEEKELLQKAGQLAAAKKFDEAAGVMKKVLKLAPKNHLYYAITSNFEREAGLFAEGLEHAKQAIKLNDKVGAYYVIAAANAFGTQDLDVAREYVQKVLKAGTSVYGEGAVNDAKVIEGFLVKKTYTITWDLDPQKGRAVGGIIQVALPKGDLPYQSLTYKVTGAKSYRLIKGEANDILNVVPNGTKSFQIVTRITVQPYSYKKRLADRKKAGALPKDVRSYLQSSHGIDPASAKLAKVVGPLKARDSIQTVKNITTWMKKNITYKLQKTVITELDFKTADDIVERGHAECRGYTVLFTALCRAAGVPARPIWGLAMLPPSQGGYASHNWCEVYITGVGWVPVDPQKPETFGFLPTNNLRLFMDAKKRSTTHENLPLLNLLFMNGEKLKYEESR
jgi:tetratricopeptide (TPR) repeat protein